MKFLTNSTILPVITCDLPVINLIGFLSHEIYHIVSKKHKEIFESVNIHITIYITLKLSFYDNKLGKYNTWTLTLYLNRYIDLSMTLFKFLWCIILLLTCIMDFVHNKHTSNGITWYFLEYSVNLPVINIYLYIIHIQVTNLDSINPTPGTGNHQQISVKISDRYLKYLSHSERNTKA